jgi:hypothetical protein
LTWGRFGVTLRCGHTFGLVSGCERTKGVDVNRPNWDHWTQIEIVQLWEAVALSLDIDPQDQNVIDAVGLGDSMTFYSNLQPQEVYRSEPVESHHDQVLALQERLSVAVDELPIVPLERTQENRFRDEGEGPRGRVYLADLAELALRRGWTLPERFPRPCRAGDGMVTVTLPYTTKKLDSLFEIMREFWPDYNSKNPPKSSTVGEAIDKALDHPTPSPGKPSRQGDTLAALIRPDFIKESDNRTKKVKPK